MNKIILVILIIYTLISLLLILLSLTNLRLFRNRSYHPPFRDSERKSINGVAYWIVRNNNHDQKWVVFLHGWWRDSRRNFGKAHNFWDNGYSMVFIDARSHGQSRFRLINNGYFYAVDVHTVLIHENIHNPVISGTSYGSTAATIYASMYPVRALVLEALPANLITLFHDFYQLLRLPRIFGWIPYLVIFLQSRSVGENKLEIYHPEIALKYLDIPIYLIHGERDELFPVTSNFAKNREALGNNNMARFWLVPGWGHSRIDGHPGYDSKLREFIHDLDVVQMPEIMGITSDLISTTRYNHRTIRLS